MLVQCWQCMSLTVIVLCYRQWQPFWLKVSAICLDLQCEIDQPKIQSILAKAEPSVALRPSYTKRAATHLGSWGRTISAFISVLCQFCGYLMALLNDLSYFLYLISIFCFHYFIILFNCFCCFLFFIIIIIIISPCFNCLLSTFCGFIYFLFKCVFTFYFSK